MDNVNNTSNNEEEETKLIINWYDYESFIDASRASCETK